MPSHPPSTDIWSRSLPASDAQNPWRLALERSGLGVWDWNIRTGHQTHSARWEEMLGYSAGELKRGFQEFASRVHPDDLAQEQLALKRYLEGLAPSYACDVRMRHISMSGIKIICVISMWNISMRNICMNSISV